MTPAKGTVETGYVSSDLNLLPTKLRVPHDCPCVQASSGFTLALASTAIGVSSTETRLDPSWHGQSQLFGKGQEQSIAGMASLSRGQDQIVAGRTS